MIDVGNRGGKVNRVFHFTEAFMFMSQAVWLDVMDGKVKGVTLRVLSFAASHVDMANRFTFTQAAIAEAMELSAPAVSKAMRELVELGYLFRVRERTGQRVWLLDARRMYRGSAARHAATVERQRKLREGLTVSEREDRAFERAVEADADAVGIDPDEYETAGECEVFAGDLAPA